MPDLFSRKASFEQVKFDIKALEFHRNRYENGAVDKLALQCYQYLKFHQEKKS